MATPEDVQAYLEGLSGRIRAPIAKAVRAQAERLAEAQRVLAREHSVSGTTVDSIRVEPGQSDLEVIVKAGGLLTTKEVREGSGVAYDYALAQEFGTTNMPAIPFFYPPYRELKDDMAEEIGAAISAAIANG